MTPEQILAEAEKQFANLRSAIENKQMVWNEEVKDGAHLFMGVCPGFTVVVGQANTTKGVQCDGLMTCMKSMFNVIKLTPEMARFCYEAATAVRN